METAQRRIQAVTHTLKPTTSWTHLVRLPDSREIFVSSSPLDQKDTPIEVIVAGQVVCEYRVLPRTAALLLSAIGTQHEATATHIPHFPVVEISVPSSSIEINLSVESLWTIIYSLFAVLGQETIPTCLSSTIENKVELRSYILRSGLGRLPHGAGLPTDEEVIYLSKVAFWQGAGTHGWHGLGFVPCISVPLPLIPSFTRTPSVITSHPMRPPKPTPGAVLYRRWVPKIGQMLEFVHFDVGEDDSVSPHLALFHKWHNHPRVNNAWGEAGPVPKHRDYIKMIMNDPSSIPVIMKWDGEAFGYAEFCYVKENHMAQYISSGADDYDRAMHILQGEDKYKDLARTTQWVNAINHYFFLSDPRTNRVYGEPRADNQAICRVANTVGMHVVSTFDFPYKRSNLLKISRERFFQQDIL